MQEDNILITVIIPAYRVEEYIEKCVDSLLSISVNKEILIVVDSWDDPTIPVCSKYISSTSDVEIILNDDKGMSEARNTGLRMAKGKYIWFVDADDYICEDCDALIWSKLQEYNPDILMFDAGVVNETDWDWDERNYIRKNKIESSLFFTGIEFFEKFYLKDAYRTPVWLNIFSKEYLRSQNLLFIKNFAHEDEDFTFKALVQAKNVIYIDEKFYTRRYRSDSAMTSGFHEKQIDDFFQIMQGNTQFIQKVWNFDLQKVYTRYLYDRINLLIDRIEISDVIDKTEWYQTVVKYFYEYILKLNFNDVSGCLMILEVIFHAKTVGNYNENKVIFDEKVERQIFEDWSKGVEDKIKRCISYYAGESFAIYGTGKHTKWLFPVFKKIADEKKLNLIFIDSNKESYTEQYEGYDIINVKDINQDTIVIISSFFKQNEIYETIRNLNIPCTIIKIYEYE